MHKNNVTIFTGIALVSLLVCLSLAGAHADDFSDVPCPTPPFELGDKYHKQLEACFRSHEAKHQAKVKADRAILAARFKAHPEQLNDPDLCDKILVKKGKNSHDSYPSLAYTIDSYYMSEACNDVTGVTAMMKRAHDADCASGNPNGPCAMGARMMEESKRKLDKDIDDLRRSMAESNQREHDRIDREYEEDSTRITRETLQDLQRDQEIQTPRRADDYNPYDGQINIPANPGVPIYSSNSGTSPFGPSGLGGFPASSNVPLSIGERLNAPGNGPDSGKTIGERLNGQYVGEHSSGE